MREIMNELPIGWREDMRMGNLSVEMHRTTANTDRNGVVQLRVKDWASGEYIISMTLPTDQFSNLMFDSHAYAIDAEFTAHPERVGKKRTAQTVNVPREITEDIRNIDEQYGPVKAWALNQSQALLTEEVRVHRDQGGWHATYARWINPEEDNA